MRRALAVVLAIVSVSFVACGDDGKPDRTIAFLRNSPIAQASQDVYLDGLASDGWKQGDNLTVVDPDPTEVYEEPEDAAAAVRAWIDDGVDLVVALSTTSAIAAAKASDSVPVVVLANDPVASGIVDNPRQPEGVVTGLSFRVPPDRTIDVARGLVGDDATIGLLWPEGDAGSTPIVDGLEEAARTLDVKLVDESFASGADVPAAVDRLKEAGADAIIVANAPSTVRALPAIEAATSAAMLPVIANTASNTFAVVVLAPDLDAAYRQLARQTARVLDGTDVAEVPVEDPGAFRLVLRTSVANRLGIEIPDELREQADEISG